MCARIERVSSVVVVVVRIAEVVRVPVTIVAGISTTDGPITTLIRQVARTVGTFGCGSRGIPHLGSALLHLACAAVGYSLTPSDYPPAFPDVDVDADGNGHRYADGDEDEDADVVLVNGDALVNSDAERPLDAVAGACDVACLLLARYRMEVCRLSQQPGNR